MYCLYSRQNREGGGAIAPSALCIPITMAIRESGRVTRNLISSVLNVPDLTDTSCGFPKKKLWWETTQRALHNNAAWPISMILKSSSLSYYIIPWHFYVDICLLTDITKPYLLKDRRSSTNLQTMNEIKVTQILSRN